MITSGDLEWPTYVVARLTRIDSRSDDERAFVSYELDGLAAEAPLEPSTVTPDGITIANSGIEALRINTSRIRFASFAGLVPEVGDWFLLFLSPIKPPFGLPLWRSPLTSNGFEVTAKGWITNMIKLFDERGEESPRHPIGAAAATAVDWGMQVAQTSGFPQEAIRSTEEIRKAFAGIDRITRVTIRDVGQASFISLHNGNDIVLYYDVGWPIAFNAKTAPASPVVDFTRAPIVLSHWDWDHLHYALRPLGKFLTECVWITPIQRLGPGASRLAQALHQCGRLFGLAGSNVSLGFGELGRCNGQPFDSNNSGLALKLQLASGQSIILVGDVDYRHLPNAFLSSVDCLVATHHGARFDSLWSTIPKPNVGRGALFASFGKGNTYRHPHPEAIQKYKAAGWTRLVATAASSRVPRGHRYFP